MKLTLAIRIVRWFLAAVIVALILLVTGVIHTYSGTNAGVVVGPIGFEWRGQPGAFVCSPGAC